MGKECEANIKIEHWGMGVYTYFIQNKQTNKLRVMSPRANYADRSTTASWQS
jgi:hypothetical protein